jgi:hypothetical protein
LPIHMGPAMDREGGFVVYQCIFGLYANLL